MKDVNKRRRIFRRACLHGSGGPQIGEVTCGGSPHPGCKHDQIKVRDYMDRRVTWPTWGRPPPCKQAFTLWVLNWAVPKKSTPRKFAYSWHFQRIVVNATKVQKSRIHFKSDVSPSVVDAKAPYFLSIVAYNNWLHVNVWAKRKMFLQSVTQTTRKKISEYCR